MSKFKRNHNQQNQNDDDRVHINHQRKRRKLSPNRNRTQNKHSKWNQNNGHQKNEKYEEDLYETNKYLKKKLRTIQQSHYDEILELKQSYNRQIIGLKKHNASKQYKLESKAIKLSTNLKKLGKMYQTLQNEYDKLLEQHQNLLNIINNEENTNNDTTYDETQYPLNDLLQSLNHENHENHQHHILNDPDMTMMEYEEKKLNINDSDKENENEFHNDDARETQDFLLSNQDHNDLNNESGFSVKWNEGTNDEYNILERNMNINHNYNYKYNENEEEEEEEEEEEDEENGFKYIETVRGKKRNELPGHECVQCRRFYAMNHNLNAMTRKKLCDCISRHRAKHKQPSTPKHFWSIDFSTQQTQS